MNWGRSLESQDLLHVVSCAVALSRSKMAIQLSRLQGSSLEWWLCWPHCVCAVSLRWSARTASHGKSRGSATLPLPSPRGSRGSASKECSDRTGGKLNPNAIWLLFGILVRWSGISRHLFSFLETFECSQDNQIER